MPCFFNDKKSAEKKTESIKKKTGFAPEIFRVTGANGKVRFAVSTPKKLRTKKEKTKQGSFFGDSKIQGLGLGSLLKPSAETKFKKLKDKENELLQEVKTLRAEEKAVAVRKELGKESFLEKIRKKIKGTK